MKGNLVVIMQRVDKPSANKIIQTLNKKIQSLGINVITIIALAEMISDVKVCI